MPEIDITRARPLETRRTMDAVQVFIKNGVRFVPMPVLNNNADRIALCADMDRRLNLLGEELKKQMEATCQK